jgi:hypothetical protein
MADAGDTAAEAAANRDLWTQANREYGDEYGDQAWDAGDITWGIFNVPGQQLGVPGDVRGRGRGRARLPRAVTREPDCKAEPSARDRRLCPRQALG